MVIRGKNEVVEIPLPSGVFAKVRPATFLDQIVGYTSGTKTEKELIGENAVDPDRNVNLTVAVIIQRTTLFDGERWTVEQILSLDARDASVLTELMMPYLKGPIK